MTKIKQILSWPEFEKMVTTLAKSIAVEDVKYVTGVPRGGVIPAIMLSHKLDIPYRELTLVMNDPLIDPQKVLVVDDIVDSGRTIERFVELGYQTASIHYRQGASIVPGSFVTALTNQDWIVYPFEREDADTVQGYKSNKQLLKD